MRNLSHKLGIAVLVIGALLAVIGSAGAATSTGISVTATDVQATCDGSTFQISFGWLADDSDNSTGGDWVGMIAYDAAGVPVSTDWEWVALGDTYTRNTPFGPGDIINAMTARPLTVVVYDLTLHPGVYGRNYQAMYDVIVGAGAPVLGTYEYDPADDVPACASLPWLGAVATSDTPGPDMVPIPDQAVVGAVVSDTVVYFAPQADAATDIVIEAGKTLWVYGVDASGAYYQVMLSGKLFWVPVGTMGPNYDDVWNGTPLPTAVVE